MEVMPMSTCPNCGHQTPRHDAKLRGMFAARVGMPAKINRRSPDAATNELATDVEAAFMQNVQRACNGEAKRVMGEKLPITLGSTGSCVCESPIFGSRTFDGFIRCSRCSGRVGTASVQEYRDAANARILAAEDVIDPHAAPLVVFGQGDYRRAFYGNNGVPRGQAGGVK